MIIDGKEYVLTVCKYCGAIHRNGKYMRTVDSVSEPLKAGAILVKDCLRCNNDDKVSVRDWVKNTHDRSN